MKAQTHFVPLADFYFDGLAAQYQKDTTTRFSLICNKINDPSFNSEALVKEWKANHPDATMQPVCSFSYYEKALRKTFTYSWMVSNTGPDDCLNISLVRKGARSAKTMLWAEKKSTLSPCSDLHNEAGVEIKTFIDEKTYKKFVTRLKAAEDSARADLYGIWFPFRNNFPEIKQGKWICFPLNVNIISPVYPFPVISFPLLKR
jgi:hypothetical protein